MSVYIINITPPLCVILFCTFIYLNDCKTGAVIIYTIALYTPFQPSRLTLLTPKYRDEKIYCSVTFKGVFKSKMMAYTEGFPGNAVMSTLFDGKVRRFIIMICMLLSKPPKKYNMKTIVLSFRFELRSGTFMK